MKRHVMLVGLPGAGKSTVGKLVAERLGAPFVDTDAVLVRKMQMPVPRMFAEFGEQRFRQMEKEAMQQVLAGPPAVLAPGGGWVAQPGALESVADSAFLIYLRAMAITAAKRAGQEGNRPLLVGEDPVEKMRLLLKEREPFYMKAACEVKADVKSAVALADEIAQLARERAGW